MRHANAEPTTSSARPEKAIFYGWWMVALGCALRCLGGGLHHYGFTIFFLPLSQDLGLSRAATSLAFSLARAEGALEGPLAGYCIDRFGPRPVMLAAVTLTGLGYILLATVDDYLEFLLVYLGVICLAYGAGFMHSPMVLANTWFIRRRAMAMTLISASIGIGGAVLSPLLAFAVQAWGWRSAAVLAGLSLLLVGFPLAAPVRRSPETMGLLPDGDLAQKAPPINSSRAGGDPRSAHAADDFGPLQAMRTASFWMLIVATSFRVAGLGTVMVHFIPLMVWKGLTEGRAALLLSTFAFLALPSHLLLGWMADRMSKPRLMACSMLLSGAALVLLVQASEEWPLWAFTVLFTLAESIFPVSWATVGDLFGRKFFATIRGTMGLFYMWGTVAAPVVAGFIYDRYQSYAPMLWALAGLFFLAAAVYALLHRPWAMAQRARLAENR
ncbi:MAG TPA: MFS transporter [Candidatus Acidoferrales bacterium]|nr:MFS transporter [Candidatus Acidoferrales bacterium]